LRIEEDSRIRGPKRGRRILKDGQAGGATIMTVLNGHYDGERIVLDEPAPSDLRPNTPVKVVIDGAPERSNDRSMLQDLVDLAVEDDDLPADYSEQLDHYVKGLPRR